MSQPINDSQEEKVTEFVLIQLTVSSNGPTTIQKAIGVYKNEQDAYAAALIDQMQYIEQEYSQKSLDDTQHEQINEICRYMKEELTDFKDRFDHMTSQSTTLFQLQKLPHYQILSIDNNSNMTHEMTESVFKTKVRNFLDAFQSKSDTEEDLGNSDDDEEDEEEEELLEGEEEDLEEDSSGEEGEHDIEEEDTEDIEELEDEGEEQTSENAVQEEIENSSAEEEDLLEEDESNNNLKRNASILEEDDEEEEDEIDEDNDSNQDELEDDEDSSIAKKRRVAATSIDD